MEVFGIIFQPLPFLLRIGMPAAFFSTCVFPTCPLPFPSAHLASARLVSGLQVGRPDEDRDRVTGQICTVHAA